MGHDGRGGGKWATTPSPASVFERPSYERLSAEGKILLDVFQFSFSPPKHAAWENGAAGGIQGRAEKEKKEQEAAKRKKEGLVLLPLLISIPPPHLYFHMRGGGVGGDLLPFRRSRRRRG